MISAILKDLCVMRRPTMIPAHAFGPPSYMSPPPSVNRGTTEDNPLTRLTNPPGEMPCGPFVRRTLSERVSTGALPRVPNLG